MQDAWLYGLHSDDWISKVQALREFGKQHGHVHVGFGGTEDPELAKFARMQRAAWKKGNLALDRYSILEGAIDGHPCQKLQALAAPL